MCFRTVESTSTEMKYGAKAHQEIPTCFYKQNSRFLIADCVYKRPGRAQVIRPTVVLFSFPAVFVSFYRSNEVALVYDSSC